MVWEYSGGLKLTESDRMRGYIQHTYCIYTHRHTQYLSNVFFLCRYDVGKSRPSKTNLAKIPKIVIRGKLPCFHRLLIIANQPLVKFKGDIHHTSYNRCSLPETNRLHLKMEGWNRIVFFWGRLGLFLCAILVSGSVSPKVVPPVRFTTPLHASPF